MTAASHRPHWKRIYRQTLTLCYKNFLVFYKAPIATICRALLFPIIVTVIFCELKHLGVKSLFRDTSSYGIAATSLPVKDLANAITSSPSRRIVFVRNGIPKTQYYLIVDGIAQQTRMQDVDFRSVDDPDDLFDLCKQSLHGSSHCFAAVIFTLVNDTNVDYSIAFDGKITSEYSFGDYRTGDSTLTERVLPLQWAIDSHIGNFSTVAKPSTQTWSGYFGPNTVPQVVEPATRGPFWLSLIGVYVAPVFNLILIGVVYHLNTFVASERETSISELMAAQSVTTTPRIVSTLASFFVLYFPGYLICSILFTQILFTKTSDILFLFLSLLAGASMVASSHFIASFFGKAQLAGLYSSTLAFALALVTLAASLSVLDHHEEVIGLSLLFPPATYANLIADVARREFYFMPFSLNHNSTMTGGFPNVLIQKMDGYLYMVFFIIQIVVFSAGTYAIEKSLWGVTRNYDKIDASSNIALKCTNISKTYYKKRRWYWPFMRKDGPVLAINKLDLTVKKGSVTFLLGPNGGGKTTTLKCIAGMTSMDPGSSLELNEDGVVFGVCPQSNVFWENLTVNEHIDIWRRLKTAAFGNLIDPQNDDVLAECDLLEKASARAKTLSGGQMRKLQLAISFVGGSKVCCIDEASSGLDPLSRRNIWNIIQKGHNRRTILVTTHFLDEADVLADHIAIVYKGKLVCEGQTTALKAQYGDNYIIRSESDIDGNTMVWRTANSAEATRKVLELESLTKDMDTTYSVTFPTLEQVFLKVTSESNTAIHDHGGDGIVGEEEVDTVIDEKIFALEAGNAQDFDLDIGHSIGLARQVYTLFCKRYSLLLQKSGWISYGINLLIPIIIASALVKFLYRMHPLQTCEVNRLLLRNASFGSSSFTPNYPVLGPLEPYYSPQFSIYSNTPSAFIGPPAAFSGAIQDDIYRSSLGRFFLTAEVSSTGYSIIANASLALSTRRLVNDTDSILKGVANYSGNYLFSGFGLFSPTPETATLFHTTENRYGVMELGMGAFGLLTNRISNATTTSGIARFSTASFRTMRHATNKVDPLSMPIAILLCLAFVASASVAVIYPAFEKNNHVRALHYCNGVSPFALWFGYLLFDTQVILIQSIFVWGLLFVGPLAKLWYASNYLLGVFILFGIATYLGTYILSLYTKKAAFAISAGLHVLLVVLYLISYIMNQYFGNKETLHQTYAYLQYGLGLSSPGANLARSLFVAGNSFEVLCGKYGDADVTNPFAYVRYGSVYANLLIQILFLIAVLAIHEYGSADWIRRTITHRGIPARLHYIIDSGDAAPVVPTEAEKTGIPNLISDPNILTISRVSKFFGKLFAVENVSFDIAANQTLALLGGNGAGKTTVINMIRGELRPNFGEIYVEGVSVLRQPQKARLHMGVCPQDDAIDNLTMRQTLKFYATVKGLKNVEVNVEKVLTALNITMYQDVSVKALSGGTRRKLSVAIALLGNPRILLLDEPSTGQDAGAKRILWRALQSISANRAILLTTHSMEEAEALATNVAIIGTKMLAAGTLTSLQQRHGGAFSVRAVRVSKASINLADGEEVRLVEERASEEVERCIKEAFNGRVRGYEDRHGQISFLLPHEREQLGEIMQTMEGFKGDNIPYGDDGGEDGASYSVGGVGGSAVQEKRSLRLLSDYTITGPTLEEVFMNVARESGAEGGV